MTAIEPRDQSRIHAEEQLFERARAWLPRDPFPHYLAHLRLLHGTRQLDVLFASEPQGERVVPPEAGFVVAHYQASAFAEILFTRSEGEAYELASASGTVHGSVLEANLVSFRDGELSELITAEHRLFRTPDTTWQRSARPGPRLEPRSEEARAQVPSLIDVSLDPAQQRVVELAPERSVLVLGEAGHGKTTVALHRLAQLQRVALERAPSDPFRAAVILPTEGLRRLIEPLLTKLGVDVEVDVYERWARAQARRAFPDLPARESQDTTAGVIRMKRDPALRTALEALCPPRRTALAKPRTTRKPKPLARRKDLLDLFGDRALLEAVVRSSTQPLGAHVLGEVLEHTHVQFSRRSEAEYAHVDRQRLVTVDGRPIDAGTPLEDAGSVDAEDYAVLFELDRLRAARQGLPPTTPRLYDCLVIDEAQEFAALELALIGRSLAPEGSLVVAGDADQQTDAAACFTSWEDSLRELGQSDYERAILPVSYRCPPAVVAIARQLTGTAASERAEANSAVSGVQPGSGLASARDGVPFVQFLNECHLGVWLVSELKALRLKDPNASVAVICRRPLTARRLYGALRHANLGRLVADGDFAFRAGVNVTHVDQVKGLEFDYVIVPDASPATYPDTADARRALYVAVTRARHQLVLGAVAGQTPLLLA